MPYVPDHLATVLVTAIQGDVALCVFTPGTPLHKKLGADLFLTDWELIHGSLTVPKDAQAPATYEPRNKADLGRLQVGHTYKVVDGWYGWLAETVLDRERVWKRRVFEPLDAIKTYNDGRREEIPGGWDHEHCEICMENISPKTQPEGYADQEDRWVCLRCYEMYVEPRSLSFFTSFPS